MAPLSAPFRARRAACALVSAALLSLGTSCVAHRHVVGVGPTGVERTSARQYYILFGLIPFNEVDTLRMADGLNGYAIESSFSLTDFVLMPILLPLTSTSRTVTVQK